MKTLIRKNLTESQKNSLTEGEYNLYLDLKSSLSNIKITIAGIIFCNQGCLYIFSLPLNKNVYIVANCIFFDIVDGSVSKYWEFYKNISNCNIYYFNYEFKNFSFLGVDRIFNEEDFYVKYHQDNDECISYLIHVARLIENE